MSGADQWQPAVGWRRGRECRGRRPASL